MMDAVLVGFLVGVLTVGVILVAYWWGTKQVPPPVLAPTITTASGVASVAFVCVVPPVTLQSSPLQRGIGGGFHFIRPIQRRPAIARCIAAHHFDDALGVFVAV
jgi:hypothetical protein